MPISEERLQVLLPRRLKDALKLAARREGVSAGEYVRKLIDADLRRRREGKSQAVRFPFGEDPIRTGRRRGSVDHDRVK